ncbi:MAG: hypothetical protein ACE5DK_10180 [Paracoccaceae bacterium]
MASANETPAANVARDGNIAILEEFESAVEQGTIAAYELFIRRHPDHPKAKVARLWIARKQAHSGED